MRSIRGRTLGWNIEIYSTPTNQFDWSVSRAYVQVCSIENRGYKYTRNVLLSAQMGERASVVLICIITSRYNEVKVWCKIVLPFPFSFSVSLSSISMSLSSRAHFSSALFVIFIWPGLLHSFSLTESFNCIYLHLC